MARKMDMERSIRIMMEVEFLQGKGKTIVESCRAANADYRHKKESSWFELNAA